MKAVEMGKKIFSLGVLSFLFFWSAALPALAEPPMPVTPQQQVSTDPYIEFTAREMNPPPVNSKCSTGKASGQCMLDYCGTDVPSVVTACMTAATAQKISYLNQGKCWVGYGCGGSKGVCCVIQKTTAGECNYDYEGKDWGNVTFKCAASAQECTSKYPGGTSTGGGYGCAMGVCCKMSKSVAQLSENSECNFDYSGGDKSSVHFVCTESDAICKSKNGTPSGKGMGCEKAESTCCKLSGTNKEYKSQIRRETPINTFCFTAKECADASGDVANWKSGQGCTNKGVEPQGYCIAPEPDYDLQYPIAGVKTIRGLKSFIALIFNTGIGILIVASAIFFVWGAFKYMVSAVGAEISNAKSTMVDALIGLALGLAAYAILANINPNTLNLKTYEIKMINRLSFYNLRYCKEIATDPSSKIKFMDAGPPDAPLDFQSELKSKGYTLTLDQTKCGNEYFIEGSDSTNICQGGGCADGKTCMTCATGIVDSAQCRGLATNRMNGCVSNNKVQIFGRVLVSSTHKVKSIQAYLYCLKSNNGAWEAKAVSVSDDSSIKMEGVQSASAGGSVGTYIINSMTKERIEQAINDCKSAGYQWGRMALLLDVERPGETIMTRFMLTKAHCNANIGSGAQDSGAVLFSTPHGIEVANSKCGGVTFFKTFEETILQAIKCNSKNFQNNYVANTWKPEEFIAAAQHDTIIQCPFTAADMVSVPNWLQNAASIGGVNLSSGF